jgi:hypothetical protein
VLDDLPRYAQHVKRLPCEDIMIGAQEINELAFLFGRELGSICTVLIGSVGLIPTALVSSSGRKAIKEVGLLQSGTAGVDDSPNRGSSDELMTAVASSKCSWSTMMMLFGPSIFSLRYV